MRTLKTALTVIGAVTVLVLAGNTVALATTGHALILGKGNSANRITALTRTTSGSALKVTTKSTANAPLTVNGRGKVANLNADSLDGLDSSALKTTSRLYTGAIDVATPVSGYNKLLPLSAGTYLISFTALLIGAEDDYVECFVRSNNATTHATIRYVADSAMTIAGAGNDPALTGSGLVTKTAGTETEFGCFTAGGALFSTLASEPIQIVVTRVDTLPTASLRTAPRSLRAAR
jgi:hypothetical protein